MWHVLASLWFIPTGDLRLWFGRLFWSAGSGSSAVRASWSWTKVLNFKGSSLKDWKTMAFSRFSSTEMPPTRMVWQKEEVDFSRRSTTSLVSCANLLMLLKLRIWSMKFPGHCRQWPTGVDTHLLSESWENSQWFPWKFSTILGSMRWLKMVLGDGVKRCGKLLAKLSWRWTAEIESTEQPVPDLAELEKIWSSLRVSLSMFGDKVDEGIKLKLVHALLCCSVVILFGWLAVVNFGSATRAKSSPWAIWRSKDLRWSQLSCWERRRGSSLTVRSWGTLMFNERVNQLMFLKNLHPDHLRINDHSSSRLCAGLLKHLEDPLKDWEHPILRHRLHLHHCLWQDHHLRHHRVQLHLWSWSQNQCRMLQDLNPRSWNSTPTRSLRQMSFGELQWKTSSRNLHRRRALLQDLLRRQTPQVLLNYVNGTAMTSKQGGTEVQIPKDLCGKMLSGEWRLTLTPTRSSVMKRSLVPSLCTSYMTSCLLASRTSRRLWSTNEFLDIQILASLWLMGRLAALRRCHRKACEKRMPDW